jgi:hypothetical protein
MITPTFDQITEWAKKYAKIQPALPQTLKFGHYAMLPQTMIYDPEIHKQYRKWMKKNSSLDGMAAPMYIPNYLGDLTKLSWIWDNILTNKEVIMFSKKWRSYSLQQKIDLFIANHPRDKESIMREYSNMNI